MEIKELRIGNIINLINIGQCSIVALERLDNNVLPVVSNEKREFKVSHNIIEPIPLTEEWLLKFGFKKHGAYEFYFDILNYETSNFFDEHIEKTNLQFYIYNEHKIEVKIDIDATNVEGEFEGKTLFLKHIQYVHQLQNLYFALTNEELTWKSKEN